MDKKQGSFKKLWTKGKDVLEKNGQKARIRRWFGR
jgi:hypothetical protein